MLKTLFFFLFFWMHQILIYPQQLSLRSMRNRESLKEFVRLQAWKVAHRWGKLLLLWSGTKAQIRGAEHLPADRPVLIVSNHQGAFDIPLLLAVLPKPQGFVAKKELGGIPMVSWWMRLIGCIFLDREDRRVQIQQIRETVETLKGGHNMVIFPEGTRSGKAEMGEFAKGSLNIAAKAGVDILPVSIKDSYKVFPAETKHIVGGTVVVTVHAPLDPAEGDASSLHERVQAIVGSAL